MDTTALSTLWRPFTQELTASTPIHVKRASGAYLYTEDGTAYLDAISSWWVTLHGHAHPHIANAIAKQAATLEHVMFADCTHDSAIQLSERLLDLLPAHFSRCFFSDNGSTAVETALKMVFQYWHNLGVKRPRVLALKNGYHGDTFGAMSVSDRSRFTKPFAPYLFDVTFVDGDIESELQKGDVACFIFEPLVQAAAGMVMHNPDEMIGLCRQYNVPTIADEVMTGFGRTGTLFAIDQLENKPDIICLAKSLTGGFLPMGVTICSEEIYSAFLSEDREKALLHGHTYAANPLGCAAALASLDLLTTEECARQRAAIEQQHLAFLVEHSNHPAFKRAEACGTILAVEYLGEPPKTYLEKNILLRPLGNTLYVIPPYCITETQLEEIYRTLI